MSTSIIAGHVGEPVGFDVGEPFEPMELTLLDFVVDGVAGVDPIDVLEFAEWVFEDEPREGEP